DVVHGCRVRINGGLGQNCARIRSVAEGARTCKDVGKCIARGLDLEPLALAWRHRNIEILRIGSHSLDWTLLAPELTADYAHMRAIIVGDFRNRARRDVLVPRVRHL